MSVSVTRDLLLTAMLTRNDIVHQGQRNAMRFTFHVYRRKLLQGEEIQTHAQNLEWGTRIVTYPTDFTKLTLLLLIWNSLAYNTPTYFEFSGVI